VAGSDLRHDYAQWTSYNKASRELALHRTGVEEKVGTRRTATPIEVFMMFLAIT
jgi:hypothetical protein